ncbi:hypothetical protein [Nocardioides sp. B-3]|uniref:hypothetical protein n=1 Tax=Nocardioides sp. B-3 TaxID=2895565 RepID=UPI002153076F|nr:hypothetical protein [Nocardioides sp. B-3]UUZ61399.1 hypothetical protein LP418_12975 [Nocardioides sp. B-3]
MSHSRTTVSRQPTGADPEGDRRPRLLRVRGDGVEQHEEHRARRQQQGCVLPARLDRRRPAEVGAGREEQHREAARAEGRARPAVRDPDRCVDRHRGGREDDGPGRRRCRRRVRT